MLPFTDFFPDFLAESPFINELENIVQRFDTDNKLSFRGYEYEYIKFRNDSEATRANDTTHNIHFGALKLSGFVVLFYFYDKVCLI